MAEGIAVGGPEGDVGLAGVGLPGKGGEQASVLEGLQSRSPVNPGLGARSKAAEVKDWGLVQLLVANRATVALLAHPLMLLGDQHHRHGGVVVEQVEEAQPG